MISRSYRTIDFKGGEYMSTALQRAIEEDPSLAKIGRLSPVNDQPEREVYLINSAVVVHFKRESRPQNRPSYDFRIISRGRWSVRSAKRKLTELLDEDLIEVVAA